MGKNYFCHPPGIFPDDWPIEERYEFSYQDWESMAKEENPFQKIDYSKILIEHAMESPVLRLEVLFGGNDIFL
jgi:hypothetical protein